MNKEIRRNPRRAVGRRSVRPAQETPPMLLRRDECTSRYYLRLVTYIASWDLTLLNSNAEFVAMRPSCQLRMIPFYFSPVLPAATRLINIRFWETKCTTNDGASRIRSANSIVRDGINNTRFFDQFDEIYWTHFNISHLLFTVRNKIGLKSCRSKEHSFMRSSRTFLRVLVIRWSISEDLLHVTRHDFQAANSIGQSLKVF